VINESNDNNRNTDVELISLKSTVVFLLKTELKHNPLVVKIKDLNQMEFISYLTHLDCASKQLTGVK
jgi:hypothetical protein